MNRKTSFLAGVALPCLIVVLSATISVSSSATLTRYDDEESFLAALGETPRTRVTFEEFESGTVISDQYPGVVFFSPNSGSPGYIELQTLVDEGAASGMQVLWGGLVPGPESPNPQIMDLHFNPAIRAFGFYLADYLPEAGPAEVRFIFGGAGEPLTLLRSNDTESEITPVFLGAVSDTPITRVTIVSGVDPFEVFEEYTIDDLIYAAAAEDTTPPVCSGRPVTEEGVLGIDGTATDFSEIIGIDSALTTEDGGRIDPQQFQSGIESVVLAEGATNVTLTVDPFEPGAASVSFRAEPADAGQDGRGTVVATDRGGNSCTLPVSFRALGPGPVENEVLCIADGLIFSVSNDNATPAGPAACSAQLPSPDDPALPPGYEYPPADDPAPCRVLTIDSTLFSDTTMVLKKDGAFDPLLRMLFSESNDGGATFPDFMDVTLSVEEIDTIVPDPTRVIGSSHWTPVKVACARQTEEARLGFCGLLGGAAGPDADLDGFALCAAATADVDCNDQRAFIHPGAEELCNGLDDDCDGTPDEDNPLIGSGEACTIPGLLGACALGETSCESGPLVCAQTHFPMQEEACNGLDDDCDGSLDEAYRFVGYLPPIKGDGSTVFLKQRGAIPVKFQLRDCSGASVTDAVARIEVLFVMEGVIGNDEVEVSSVGSANTDDFYRYDPEADQYIYNLDASSLQSYSVYVLRTHLDDGTTHDVTISIK